MALVGRQYFANSYEGGDRADKQWAQRTSHMQGDAPLLLSRVALICRTNTPSWLALFSPMETSVFPSSISSFRGQSNLKSSYKTTSAVAENRALSSLRRAGRF